MKNGSLFIIAVAAIIALPGCKMLGKNKKSKDLPNDGQVYGVSPAKSWTLPKPPGMVYIPPGTFHMGPSDEDINYAYTARSKQVSISGFWMDATEVTNNEYRQFVYWVRDSVTASELKYVKTGKDGNEYVDWQKMKTVKWNDPKFLEQLGQTNLILPPDDRIFGRIEIDPRKMIYHSKVFDLKEAARR